MNVPPRQPAGRPWATSSDRANEAVTAADLIKVLASVPPQQQKQVLGEQLFDQVKAVQPELAGKITGMLLEVDNRELAGLCRNPPKLFLRVAEAVEVLWVHRAVPAGAAVQELDLEGWLAPAARPLLTRRQLATMPATEWRDLMEPRLFYQVHRLQPLFAWNTTARLLADVQRRANFYSGWSQEGERWVSNTADFKAASALSLLDDPLHLGREVCRLCPKDARLRSDEAVMEATAALSPQGEVLSWAPTAAVHARFPPLFRRATCTLLLSKARARRLVVAATAGGGGQVSEGMFLLDCLPDELVPLILELAARPLDAWV